MRPNGKPVDAMLDAYTAASRIVGYREGIDACIAVCRRLLARDFAGVALLAELEKLKGGEK